MSRTMSVKPWALAGAMIGFVMLAAYLAVLKSQGSVWSAAFPWSLLMAIAAIGAVTGALIEDRRTARPLMIGAAALFAVIGLASILTIGLGFLLASAAVGIEVLQTSKADRSQPVPR